MLINIDWMLLIKRDLRWHSPIHLAAYGKSNLQLKRATESTFQLHRANLNDSTLMNLLSREQRFELQLRVKTTQLIILCQWKQPFLSSFNLLRFCLTTFIVLHCHHFIILLFNNLSIFDIVFSPIFVQTFFVHQICYVKAKQLFINNQLSRNGCCLWLHVFRPYAVQQLNQMAAETHFSKMDFIHPILRNSF